MSLSPITLSPLHCNFQEVRISSVLLTSGVTVPGILLVLSKCVAVE